MEVVPLGLDANVCAVAESKSNKVKKKQPTSPETTDWGKGPSPAAL